MAWPLHARLAWAAIAACAVLAAGSAAQPLAQQQGEWIESFRAATGPKSQTSLQMYGTPAAISDDGTLVVVGCEMTFGVWEARIYRDDTVSFTGWSHEKTLPMSGFSTAISSDGTRVAVGDVYSNAMRGRVVVVNWDGQEWTQVGNEIKGDVERATTGYSVALSGDGNTLVVGSRDHPVRPGGRMRGRVEIFRLSTDGTAWERALLHDGESDLLKLGHAVSINRAGDRVLASAGVDLAVAGAGTVYTFALGGEDGRTWSRAESIAQPASSGKGQTAFGCSVAMTTDASMAAVAACRDVVDLPRGQNGRISFHNPANPAAGPSRPDLTYVYPNGAFGASLAVSGSGGIVAVGTNSFLGGIYTYSWDALAGEWWPLRYIPVSTATALGRALALSESGRRMLYLERASRQMVVVDFVPNQPEPPADAQAGGAAP